MKALTYLKNDFSIKLLNVDYCHSTNQENASSLAHNSSSLRSILILFMTHPPVFSSYLHNIQIPYYRIAVTIYRSYMIRITLL